jgi:predicted nucleotidyltransferase
VYLGYTSGFEQAEGKDPYDLVVYEVRKFFKLASACNPNIIEVLHTDPSVHIHVTSAGQKLLDNKDAFLSLKAKHTFSGYAHAQLKRIETHFRWLSNPPKGLPTRGDFGLEEKMLIPRDQLGVVEAEIRKKVESFDFDWSILDEADRINLQGCISGFLAEMELTSEEVWLRTGRSLGFDDNFLAHLAKERLYKAKVTEWEQFQNWCATRNPKRAELERKFGYDTKHGSHLVRLMKMCKEILTEGKVNVRRTDDREELLAIKNHGIWPYEKLIEWSNEQEKMLNDLYKTSTVLPKEPDHAKLNLLCEEIVLESLDKIVL